MCSIAVRRQFSERMEDRLEAMSCRSIYPPAMCGSFTQTQEATPFTSFGTPVMPATNLKSVLLGAWLVFLGCKMRTYFPTLIAQRNGLQIRMIFRLPQEVA